MNEADPMTWDELAGMGVKFIFITLAAQHAMGYGASQLLADLKARKQDGYIDLQRKEWASNGDVDGAELVRIPLHDNRDCSFKVRAMDGTMDQAVAATTAGGQSGS